MQAVKKGETHWNKYEARKKRSGHAPVTKHFPVKLALGMIRSQVLPRTTFAPFILHAFLLAWHDRRFFADRRSELLAALWMRKKWIIVPEVQSKKTNMFNMFNLLGQTSMVRSDNPVRWGLERTLNKGATRLTWVNGYEPQAAAVKKWVEISSNLPYLCGLLDAQTIITTKDDIASIWPRLPWSRVHDLLIHRGTESS